MEYVFLVTESEFVSCVFGVYACQKALYINIYIYICIYINKKTVSFFASTDATRTPTFTTLFRQVYRIVTYVFVLVCAAFGLQPILHSHFEGFLYVAGVFGGRLYAVADAVFVTPRAKFYLRYFSCFVRNVGLKEN